MSIIIFVLALPILHVLPVLDKLETVLQLYNKYYHKV